MRFDLPPKINLIINLEGNSNVIRAIFSTFREKILGYNQSFETPYGIKQMIYADWAASGRLYAPIEEKLKKGWFFF